MAVKQHFNLIDSGTATFTASTTVTPQFNRQIERVMFSIPKATAPSAIVAVTYAISADKKTFTIYGWKHTSTSNPTLIAADASGTVDWFAVGE